MKIVLDTNVLLNAILPSSRYHWLLEQIIGGKFTLCVTTDILNEYTEVLERFYNPAVAEATLVALLYSPFVEQYAPTYFWQLIEQDHDDDKFVDCTIAASAQGVITHDRHFNALKSLVFPRVTVLTPDELWQIFES